MDWLSPDKTAKIKASADPVSGEDLLPGSQHLLAVSSLEGRDRELSGLFFYKDTDPILGAPPPGVEE